MAKPFHELKERLLRAGVAPRHVRRYLAELADHWADLRAEEERAGRAPEEAESTALMRLGRMEDLADAMLQKTQLRSWCWRAPWAAFGLAPVFFLAAAWSVALFILWSGWKMFLPEANTPFIPVSGVANLYFQAGKAFYYAAPVLTGWGLCLIAARQRFRSVWLFVGLVLIAFFGGTAQVHAGRTAVPYGVGHIRMDLALGAGPDIAAGLLHAFIILLFTALPYLVWRLRKPLSA